MKNVYESVRLFFEEELTDTPIIARDWVEGFLRQKAWAGSADKDLHVIWKQVRALQIYLSYTHYQTLDELVADDYADALRWLDANPAGFKVNLRSARQFFSVLEEFYHYLVNRKLSSDTHQIQVAAEMIAGGKRLNLASSYLEDQDSHGNFVANLSTDFLQGTGIFPETIEKLMLKIGGYFQREAFDEDFHRALYLYVGPLQAIPTVEDDGFSDFWIGFWDYFLFDYHLRQDDLTPVTHYLQGKHRLTSVEKTLLLNLSAAQFTVFYIQRVIDGSWVECVNLLTDEVFQMPYPEFDYKIMKRLLFYGHVFANGTFVANYVASIEVSVNLRQRIKHEALRLKAIFTVQQPNSTWQDFIVRHCLAIRHTVTLLTAFAKLNVTAQETCSTPKRPDVVRQPDYRVCEELRQLMPKYGFSVYDLSLAESMWQDFCQLCEVTIRKTGGWSAAIISCYATLNTSFAIPIEELAEEAGVSTASIYTNRRRLTEVLSIVAHDPRYLSEEGIILLLYSS